MDFRPNIMRMCNDKERAKLIATATRFVEDGKWIGARGPQKRAVISMRTEKGNAEAEAGKRKKRKPTDSQRLVNPQITFQATHVLLIKDGRFPVDDDEASHLCHHSDCIDISHIIWERGDYNRRRKHCSREGKCICRLHPPCMFDKH